jgi:predicted ThiF/HesA family dinucleotide-utilizing enzyme
VVSTVGVGWRVPFSVLRRAHRSGLTRLVVVRGKKRFNDDDIRRLRDNGLVATEIMRRIGAK